MNRLHKQNSQAQFINLMPGADAMVFMLINQYPKINIQKMNTITPSFVSGQTGLLKKNRNRHLLPLMFGLILWSGGSYAQNSGNPFDHTSYNISLFVGKERDSYQTLSFSSEDMTFSEADQYGFKPESFKSKQKNDSTWTFVAVSKSAKNGLMTWQGKVVNERIEGTCIWTRKVENPVNYTFEGKLGHE